MKQGTIGYVVVDVVTKEAKLHTFEDGLKYMPTSKFSYDLDRHIRFSYPTKIFGNKSFEIDNDGIVKISIYDIFTKSVYGEPIILDSVNPKYFKYTTARKNDNVKPTFKANASLSALATHSKSVIVDIPLLYYNFTLLMSKDVLKNKYTFHHV